MSTSLGSRIVAGCLATALVLVSGASLLASHDIVLRGALQTSSFSAFRVVAARSNVATDVTADGLRVGVAPDGEERIALCRPVFIEDIGPFAGYDVVSAVPDDNPIGASFMIPTTSWGAASPAQDLFAMKAANPVAATTTTFRDYFQTLLKRGNEPTANLGFLLTGTQDFRTKSGGEIYFTVRLGIPFRVDVLGFFPECPNALLPVPQPIQKMFMSWKSSRSGTAIIGVNNGVATSLPIRVQGQRVKETELPAAILQRGQNAIVIRVTQDDPDAGQAPLTVNTTLTIGDVICPWDPGRPPGLQQPPR